MIHNASENNLPEINEEMPPVSLPNHSEEVKVSDTERKYGIISLPSHVASNPMNQMWIQGPPPVFIDQSGPPMSRAIDALACAIRSSLHEFEPKRSISQSSGGISRTRKNFGNTLSISDGEAKDETTPKKADKLLWEEFSCRNLLAQASSLLQKYEDVSPSVCHTFSGHHLLISALDAVFNMDRDDPGESNHSEIQNLLSVLKAIIERPILLFQGGPTYHITNNCAIFMAHFINKLHMDGIGQESAKALFDEVFDVYNGSRIVLNNHRCKLPHQLRCHEIPRPNIFADAKKGEAIIDLSKLSLCTSLKCQHCIMTGRSFEKVSKRAKMTARAKSVSEDTKSSASSSSEFEGCTFESKEEFDVDDRALLAVLSRIVSPYSKS